jgi:hypothetical protein
VFAARKGVGVRVEVDGLPDDRGREVPLVERTQRGEDVGVVERDPRGGRDGELSAGDGRVLDAHAGEVVHLLGGDDVGHGQAPSR